MPDGPAIALEEALLSTLRDDPQIGALVGAKIHVDPPKGANHPYVLIGGIDPRPVRSTCGKAYQVNFGIEVHGSYRSGRRAVTKIAEAVERLLDQAPPLVAGFVPVTMLFDAQTVAPSRDLKEYIALSAFYTLLDVSP